jgi:hypothetical protein
MSDSTEDFFVFHTEAWHRQGENEKQKADMFSLIRSMPEAATAIFRFNGFKHLARFLSPRTALIKLGTTSPTALEAQRLKISTC